MNRWEFYSNLDMFKKNSLKHTQYGNGYIHRIDHYYGFNKPRYFYTQEEWDAYQKEKNAEKEKRQELVDKAKIQDEKMNGENRRREQERIKREKYEKEKKAEERRIKAEEMLARRDAEIKDNISREQERIKKENEIKEKYKKDISNAEKYSKQAEKNKEEAKEIEDKRLKEVMNNSKTIREIQENYSGNFRKDFNELSTDTTVTMDQHDTLNIDNPKLDKQIKEYEQKCTDLQNEYLKLSNKKDKTTDKYEKQSYETEMQNNMMNFWDVYNALNKLRYERDTQAMNEFYDICKEMGINVNKYIKKEKPTIKNAKVTTWDDANVQTWDNTEKKLYENVLYEDKLYEDILKENKI